MTELVSDRMEVWGEGGGGEGRSVSASGWQLFGLSDFLAAAACSVPQGCFSARLDTPSTGGREVQ